MRTSRRTLRITAMVAALGFLAAGCCKNVAPDPAAEEVRQFREGLIRQIALPAAVHAEPWLEVPFIRLEGNDVTVDGAPSGRLGSETGTDELRVILRNKRELWQQIHAGRPFPGIAMLAAGRDTAGEKVDAIAGAALKAGFPNLRVLVHAVEKGELSPDSLGIVPVHLLALTPGDSSADPDGMRLALGPANMAVMSWRKAGGETEAEPVALIEEKRGDGTIHLPGLVSAVGRSTAAHPEDKRIAVLSGIHRVPLAKVVAIADVFSNEQYEVLWQVVPR